MKLLKIILTVLIFSITINSNAQFFKKLKEKAEQKIKREAERRAQRRVDNKIDKTFDSAENKIDKTVAKKPKKAEKSKSDDNSSSTASTTNNTNSLGNTSSNQNSIDNNNDSQTTFDFTHIYSFEMKPEKGKPMNFNYFLKKNATYLATEIPDMKNKMISIMDFQHNKMIMLMENKNEKTRMKMKMDFTKTKNDAQDEVIKINKTGKHKDILGFPCDEYFVEGKDFTSTVWITNKAGITFPEQFTGAGNKKMRNQNNRWMFKMNGIVMEMIVTDTSKKKPKKMSITCTKLEKTPKKINILEYKKLM